MCAGFAQSGYAVGGFDAYTTSKIAKGAGLSSSAAFEVMVGCILNHMYNGGKVDSVSIAKVAQYAENEFFGKPCGLMDQIACAYGGIVAIDFADPKSPVIEKLNFDLTKRGYNLCIVDSGGSHAGLTDEYAAVAAEMGRWPLTGRACLREVDKKAYVRYRARVARETARCCARCTLWANRRVAERSRHRVRAT